MTATRYLRVLMIITFTVGDALRLSCEPGEEFKSHNLTCDIRQGKSPFSLTTDFNYISTCTRNQKPPCDNVNDLYVTSLMDQTITLNILNVTGETVGKYSCIDANNGVSECDFKIYAKPESVSCQVQQLPTNNVTVTCTVTRTYPSPICQFYWYKNGTETSLPNQTINYKNISGEDQSKYFYQTCIMTQPAQNLGLGTHTFKVRAYPNVTGSTSDTNYGIDSSQTPNVTINYPIIQLELCTQGYVQEGSPVSCSCRETANTFLSATTSFSQGLLVQSSGPGFTTYNFTASRNTGDLICQATLLGWTSSPVTYKPLVAYGPKNVTVKVNSLSGGGDISLCDKSQPVTVTITCTVSYDIVNPGADFKFNINGSEMTANPVNVSSLTYSVTNGGTLSVQCTGSNSALKEITATSPQQQVQVIEPPAAPPVIDKYQDNGSPVNGTDGLLTVLEGYNKIRCRADGGYPPVSNVSVGCGTLTNTSVGNVAFQDVNVSRSMDASKCSCTASHSSPCYRNNKTVISLDVLYADPSDGSGVNIVAVVDGVVIGIVVIAAIVLVVLCLKRKGLLKKGVRKSNEADNMQTLSLGAQKAPHYVNIPPTLPKNNRLSSSEYEEISDGTQQPQYEEIRDVTQEHMHKKVVDIQPHKPDNFEDYTNRDVLDRGRYTVEYENEVSVI